MVRFGSQSGDFHPGKITSGSSESSCFKKPVESEGLIRTSSRMHVKSYKPCIKTRCVVLRWPSCSSFSTVRTAASHSQPTERTFAKYFTSEPRRCAFTYRCVGGLTCWTSEPKIHHFARNLDLNVCSLLPNLEPKSCLKTPPELAIRHNGHL